MRKVLKFLLEVAAMIVIGMIIRMVPWSEIFAGEVAGGRSLKETLSGRWQAENGNLKGATFLFTESGATTWVIPADMFGMTDCTLNGTYKIFAFHGSEGHPAGTYVRSTLLHKSGNCKESLKVPDDFDGKIDVVDASHVLLDTASLVRTN